MKKENGVINIRASRPITEDQVELRRALIEKASRPLGRVRQEHDPASTAAATAAEVVAASVAGSVRKANSGRTAQPGRRNPRTAKGKRRVKAPSPEGLSDLSDDDNETRAKEDEGSKEARGESQEPGTDDVGTALSARARRLRSRSRTTAAQSDDTLPPQFGPEDDPALPADAQILAILAVRTTERPREKGEKRDKDMTRPKVRRPDLGLWCDWTAG